MIEAFAGILRQKSQSEVTILLQHGIFPPVVSVSFGVRQMLCSVQFDDQAGIRKESPPPSDPKNQRELAAPRLAESGPPFPAMFPTDGRGKPRSRFGHDRFPRLAGRANG
jgi:hypothetical protein